MDQNISGRLNAIYEQTRLDKEYRQLLEEYRVRSEDLRLQLETMNDRQRDVILDYLGLAEEMHRKLLEYACKL